MKICFILPAISRVPIGGYKMVYEYANRFAYDQNQVILLFMNDGALRRYHIPIIIRKKIINLETKIEPRWFKLNSSIKKISTTQGNWLNYIKDIDVVVATAVETTSMLDNFFENSKKAYFIQDYENWNISDESVRQTYAKGYINIVISDWLKKIVDENSLRPSILIKNPIDLEMYRLLVPLKDRKQHTISLLYHKKEHKGVKYALQALQYLHDIYPDLEVYMFGVFEYNDKSLPWIHYTRRASQKQTVDIYNKTRIFICATVEEGYGLTGLEAMACGNVLVSTNYSGVREYARNEYNSLLSPVKDVSALVKNVQRVFDNEKLYNKLIENVQQSVKNFSWEHAFRMFKDTINDD